MHAVIFDYFMNRLVLFKVTGNGSMNGSNDGKMNIVARARAREQSVQTSGSMYFIVKILFCCFVMWINEPLNV